MADHGYFEELICAELDGELTPAQAEELRAHLAECERCRNFREAMAAVEGVPARYLPEPPAQLAADVMAHIRAQKRQTKKKGKLLPFPGRSLAAAAAAALVLWAGARATNLFSPKASTYSAAGAAAESVQAEEKSAAVVQSRGAASYDMAQAPAAAPEEAMDGVFSVNTATEMAEAESLQEGEVLCRISDRNGVKRTVPFGQLPEGLLVPDEPCETPDREPDYTLLVLAPEGEEEEYRLWEADGGMIVATDTGETGFSVPAEVFEEFLNK